MTLQNGFIQYLQDMFEPCGPIRAKAMFGGFGIYKGGQMFALVADNVLYLKADDILKAEFEALGLVPFSYPRKGKMYAMSYYQAPPETMEDSAVLCEWALKSYEAALRAASVKKRRRT